MNNSEAIEVVFDNIDSCLSSSYILSSIFKNEDVEGPVSLPFCAFIVVSRVLLVFCLFCILIGTLFFIQQI